jgi:hypothetical protein
VRQFYSAVVSAGKKNDVQALGRGFFARSIDERLQMAGLEIEPVLRSAQSHALAGSFFSLLDWWIDKGMKADPSEMDRLFHRHQGATTVLSQLQIREEPPPRANEFYGTAESCGALRAHPRCALRHEWCHDKDETP